MRHYLRFALGIVVFLLACALLLAAAVFVLFGTFANGGALSAEAFDWRFEFVLIVMFLTLAALIVTAARWALRRLSIIF